MNQEARDYGKRRHEEVAREAAIHSRGQHKDSTPPKRQPISLREIAAIGGASVLVWITINYAIAAIDVLAR